MTAEGYVQLAPDGAGKKVRNLVLTEPSPVDASGNAVEDLERYQQVVTPANAHGGVDAVTLGDVRDLLVEIHETLLLISGQLETP